MDGLLLVDKPVGLSSYDVIRRLKPLLPKGIKIGHAGTLDPLATGLLLILIGRATKQATQLLKLDKTYEGQITLGATSATDDAEGPILEVRSSELGVRKLTENEVKKVLQKFEGDIEQIPPAHSAIKVGGQRAYRLARKGQHVKLAPRMVTIYDLKLTSYDYPLVGFTAKVSSGTYIRSLARDIGEKLGTGGYLSQLRRTQIGDYDIKDAIVPAVTLGQIGAALLVI
ncbi:tRNA pseudouridine(55) synthase TruB [Candidatus Microgenomates bacterium]|nr:tRNA pseudouridine(55) synthase TruB [Candidatus Microgenomates bacterium]